MCFLALAAVINIVGANIALALRLPVYLDTIGTFMASAMLGPFYGMVPGLLSGLISGITTDIYSLYYIPVQLITALMAGLAFGRFRVTGWRIFPCGLMISIPGTVVSSVITACVFGGITSSGSSLIVQLLHGAGMNLTASVCIVQAGTDYLDRIIGIFVAVYLLKALPHSMREMLSRKKEC